MATHAAAQRYEQTIDSATLQFFQGVRFHEPVISTNGGRIVKLSNAVVGGRAMGAVTELRDLSMLMPESRTYAGLTTTMGGADGGNAIPIGFIPTVLAAMKHTDAILEAANWDLAQTVDGRPTNQPS